MSRTRLTTLCLKLIHVGLLIRWAELPEVNTGLSPGQNHKISLITNHIIMDNNKVKFRYVLWPILIIPDRPQARCTIHGTIRYQSLDHSHIRSLRFPP